MPRAKSQTENSRSRQRRASYSSFGDSYSSLILGIIVVIVGTILLLSLVRNRNIEKTQEQLSQVPPSVTQITRTNMKTVIQPVTTTPVAQRASEYVTKPTPTATAKKVAETMGKETPSPTMKSLKPHASKNPQQNAATNKNKLSAEKSYTVKMGDNLWTIALGNYGSGYNWVDIARANKLSNPSAITVGQKLTLPQAEQKNATSEPEWRGLSYSNAPSMQSEKITANQYTVRKGDNLWSIAVRAYGDGYSWVKISNANKLSNPSRIHSGNVLSIPR